jgi:branched-chain amino acid transport system ATP-binding protein
MSSLLQAKALSKWFGGVHALDSVSLQIRPGEIVGLIGPNGAGKTTLFNVLTGTLVPDEGELIYKDTPLPPGNAPLFAKLGLARTFQHQRLFVRLSVEENIRVAALTHPAESDVRTKEALEFVSLTSKKDVLPASLNLFERKRLELGRAFALSPKILFLDEIMAGLTFSEGEEVVRLLRRFHERNGPSLVWIEHRIPLLRTLIERLVVMHQGKIIADGAPDKVLDHGAVIESYLGSGGTHA